MFIAALWTFVCFLLFFCDTAWLVFKGFLWSSGFVLFAVFVLFMFMLCCYSCAGSQIVEFLCLFSCLFELTHQLSRVSFEFLVFMELHFLFRVYSECV